MNRRKFLRETFLAAPGALLLAPARAGAQVSGARQKILIVGAGLAGMAAAFELGKLGHEVSLFEAQPRAGGRILTVRDFDENLYAEAGAARLHRDHDLPRRYAREFGLRLVDFYPAKQKFAVFEDGRTKTVGWEEFADAAAVVVTLEKQDRWQKIAGGNDRLTRAFAARLGEKIRYSAPVVKIAHTARDAAVTFRQNDKLETVRGDYLICTIPLTMLRKIEIEPRFSDAKTDVIQNLKYEAAARVLVQTKRRFWHAAGLNGFGMGENFAEIWNATLGQAGTRGILQTYLRGDDALDLMKRAESERLAASVEALEKLFPTVGAQFEKGFTKCWHEDPWTLGAWAHPGKNLEIVRRPEGRVHFAGDHASDLPSWMQGALQSAMRVVEEIKVR